MFLHVSAVEYEAEYRLRIVFDDGAVKVVDLAHELEGEVFEPLRDWKVFRQVRLNPDTGTSEWPNGADLAPEFLYEIGVADQPAALVAEPPAKYKALRKQ